MVFLARVIGTVVILGLSAVGAVSILEWFEDTYTKRDNVVPLRRV